jgi:hypothetical protein
MIGDFVDPADSKYASLTEQIMQAVDVVAFDSAARHIGTGCTLFRIARR